ncbi:uncharacterized protein [Malus domestica]|uniref:uncharacterized protein isoform X5 n=1 Tax=Malus domestica TaxID=3750 RepID=UPI0039750F26
MAATVISSVIANLKVLSHDNYEDWSFHFKTYLLAEDLWEVVEETSEPPRQEDGEAEFLVWRKNNAKVLHAIHTCCGDDTHFIIRGISSAKVAWDTLAEKLKPTDQALENTEDVPLMAHEELNTGLTRNEDIALDLIQRCPNLTFATNSTGKTLLQELACMPSLFLSGTRLRFWQQWIYNSIDIRHASGIHDVRIDVQKQANDPVNDQGDLIIRSVMALLQGLVSNLRNFFGIDHMYKMKQIHVQSLEVLQGMCKMTEGLSLKQMQGSSVQTALFKAVEHGNDEFLRQLFTANILALGIYDENAKGMFQFSIECRQEKVYNFFHEFIQIMNVRTESRVDKFNNTLLHSAARLSPPAQLKHIQCAALQMQRELQWFKEVEKIVPSKFLEVVNHPDGMTARDLFTKNHKELAKEGERSMKATATSCTVVAALIVTIMFIAVFSVPGGSKAGFPVFLNKRIFMVFIVADVFSLFSATTSVVTFLGILNSRYAEDDFLKSLQTKMMIGLFTLFSSIVTMMIAFSSTLFLMLEAKKWLVYPMILLASVPVVSFVWMQFSLLVEIFISTYGAGIFLINKKSKPWSFSSS